MTQVEPFGSIRHIRDFRVLTLNIHKGFSAANRRFTLEDIRKCLRESGSNIVFLQEVVGEHDIHRDAVADWPDTNQFEYLADSVWDHYAYGKNAIYQHGHHGNAILSELPFDSLKNVDVSTTSFSRRGILHGQLENGVHLLCVHLGLLRRERGKQAAMLADYISSSIPAGAPLILAGDFNDWRTAVHPGLSQELGLYEAFQQRYSRLARTFPSRLPILHMDRIYVRGFQVRDAEVLDGLPWREISDHCALMADIRLDTDNSRAAASE